MNKKLLIAMWCGIAAFALLGILFKAWGGPPSMPFVVGDIAELLARWLVIAVVTAGLIYTLADKKDKKPKDEQNNK